MKKESMVMIAKTKTLTIKTIFCHPYLKEFWICFELDEVSSNEISKTSAGIRAAEIGSKITDTIAKLTRIAN